MYTAASNRYLVDVSKKKFKRKDVSTKPPSKASDDKKLKKELEKLIPDLHDLQRMMYAQDKYALLLVFQAMDAAGKDSTIRTVMSGVNPAGCQVYSFKSPSSMDLDHDFLWRTARCLPERGRIGIFNRSYYEEVLVVRVHPEYLKGQKLPPDFDQKNVWKHRFESIRDHEKHLARNGTVILKFWLNVSKEEQKNRFLSRLDEPHKNWKFSSNDVKERQHWNDYMGCYEDLINETSEPWAPWFAIPADNKPYMRLTVAKILVDNLKKMGLKYPEVDPKERERFDMMRRQLEEE